MVLNICDFAFHAGNRGSNPRGDANKIMGVGFVLTPFLFLLYTANLFLTVVSDGGFHARVAIAELAYDTSLQ